MQTGTDASTQVDETEVSQQNYKGRQTVTFSVFTRRCGIISVVMFCRSLNYTDRDNRDIRC